MRARKVRKERPLRLTQYSSVWLKLDDLDDRDRLDDLLGYWKVDWKGGKRNARRVNLASRKGWLFAGFLPLLKENFDVRLTAEEELEFPRPQIKVELAKIVINLRDYQEDALMSAAWQHRGVISMPTGTGKTVVAAGLLAAAPKARALFVVHTKDLMDQTISEFKTMLGKTSIGYVGDGKKNWRQRTVGMIQSMKDYSFKKNPVDIVMVDEAHHVAAKTYIDLLKKTKCLVRLGFTGTTRTDREGELKSLGILGPTIFHYPYRQAVADGWLAQAHIRMLPVPFCEEIAGISDGFRAVYNAGIIHNQERNELIVREANLLADQGATVLIQVKEVVHGEILEKLFEGKAEFVKGADDRERRSKIKKLLKAGKINTVIASPLWDEGVDIPDLGAIVVAGGGLSEIKAIQKVGRGLRKTEEKDTVQVIDFYDNSHRYLRKHSKERMRIYEDRGWIIDREY